MINKAPSPQPRYHTERTILEREVVIETFRSGGPGGQHRNVTDSGVRLFHVPSGVRVSAVDSRSQHQNREMAFARLIERLRRLNQIRKPRVPTHASRPAIERRLKGKRLRQTVKETRARMPNFDE